MVAESRRHPKQRSLQGRRKLPKAGWASSSVRGTTCPLWLLIKGLTDQPKPGWTIAHPVHPAHPSPTSLGPKHMTDLWSFSWSQVVKVEHTKLTTESFPLALITTVIIAPGCLYY